MLKIWSACVALFGIIGAEALAVVPSEAVEVAPASAAFDLDCHGTIATKSRKNDKPHPSKFHWRLHIDLDNKIYCDDECQSVDHIARIEDERIILKDRKDYAGFENYEAVNRRTGAYVSHDYFPIKPGPQVFEKEGLCTKADFTPFPRRKF